MFCGPSHAAGPKRNVLFIVSDDLNAGFATYGHPQVKTPHLDRLAAMGRRFDRAYCNYPVCNASRTSFLSGRLPRTTQVVGNGVDPRVVLGADFQFLPEHFKAQGYFTAGIGKITHTPEFLNSIRWDVVTDPQHDPALFQESNARVLRTRPDEAHPDGITARLAARLMEEHRNGPFFIAAGFHRPHSPLIAPQKYFDLYPLNQIHAPTGPVPTDIPAIARPTFYDANVPPDEARRRIQGYYACVTFMDAQVGVLLEAMDRLDLWRNTVVVFLSDNGYHLGEHGGFWGKSSLMDQSARVPLIVCAPDIKGGPCTRAVSLVDLFPTLTELCGLPQPAGLEGRSLAPLLRDPATPWEHPAQSVVVRGEKREGRLDLGRSAHTETHTFIQWPDGSRQLYDDAADPAQNHNLIADPTHAGLAARLQAALIPEDRLPAHRGIGPGADAAGKKAKKEKKRQKIGSRTSPQAAVPAGQPADKRPPNVVILLADDLGWSDTTLYGTTKLYQTPNIERLAARGMTFTRAYSASPLCSPTRSAILTGLSPARTGITTPNCHLPQVVLDATPGKSAPPNQHSIQPSPVTRLRTDYPTLPKALKAAGYVTGHFGKWHLGPEPYSPLEHGFDVDIPHWPGPGPAGSFVAPWKFPDFKEKSPGEHLEDRMAAEAVAWMEQNKDRPFFLNYWQFSVHAPFDAKRALIEKYRPLVNPADPQRSPTYAAMIESFDDAIGTLLDALDRLQLADKTIILFTSDNGGNLYSEVDGTTPTSNAPLRGGKATMFEGGVRVPQIIAWPGITRPGSRSDALTQSEDFFPTLIEGLGLKPAAEQRFDGISILPALKDLALDRQAVLQYFPHNPGVPDWLPPSVSVHRSDGWKLIRLFHAGKNGAHRHLLFNLNEDQGEKTNLAAQQPALVKELDALIDTFLADTKAVLPIPNPAFDPAKYRPELEGVQTNKKGAKDKGKAAPKAAPASPQAAKPRQAATFRVFAGGVAGVEDLANAEHSTRFRASGGGLYLHNNGWAALSPEQQRQALAVFKGRPIAIELGFNPGAEAWAQRYRTGYAPYGMKPEFICANAFDQNNRPTPEQWTHYMHTLRETGGVPKETLILPTFEYANFAPNIATLADNKVSQRDDFQAIIRTAGGITLDTPPGYFFSREQNYRDWIVDAIRWTRAAGLRVVHIVSPHRSGEQFDEDTEKILAHLREHDALPDTLVSENYEAAPPPGYPNRVGPESVPHTALGVALHLIAQNQLAAWEASKDAALSIKDGALVITATGGDPYIITRQLPAGAKGPFTLKLRLSSTAAGPGMVYFATPQHPAFHRDRSVSFDLIHDGQPHDYEVSLPVETLSSLRLDPGNTPGRITLHKLELHDAAGTVIRSLPQPPTSTRP